MRMLLRGYSLALLAITTAVGVWGQVTTSTVSGTVKDAGGAVIPGAQVVATNVDTGNNRSATTDSSGRHLILRFVNGEDL